MAWWSSLSNASKLATLAIKEAQRRIDQALDIEDDTNLSTPIEVLPKTELYIKAEVDTPKDSSILQVKTPACTSQDSQLLTEDLQMKNPDVTPFLSAPISLLPKVSDEPSFGALTRQRHASQPTSSLSSGPMPEDIVCDEDDISTNSTKSLQDVHSCDCTPSVSLTMGDTLTSELSNSETLATKPSSPATLTTTVALATSEPALPSDDSVPDLRSPDFLDKKGEEMEREEAQRQQLTTSPQPLSPRTQDDVARSEDHLEDDANTTTMSSEIEVISCCTSLNGDVSNGSGNANTVLLTATEQLLPYTEFPQDLGPRNRSLSQLARPVSGPRTSDPLVASHPSEDISQVLEAREAKILELSRVNISLQEANTYLQSQLAQASGSAGNLNDLDSLTDEFTKRLALTEHRLQVVTKERNQLRTQLSAEARHSPARLTAMESSSEKSLRNRCAKLEALVSEKETQIQEILKEGERMAQEQLKANNLVKSLRAKEKTNELQSQRTSSALTKAQAEIGRLKSELATARDGESKNLGALNQVNRQSLKLEKELAGLNVELGLSREKVELLEKTTQALEAEKRQMAEKLEETQMNLSAANSRLEAMQGSEQQQAALHEETDRLRSQIDQMRRAASKQQHILEQARDQTAQELAYCRSRLANAEMKLELMDETASSVAKPLLSRIESLQSCLDSQTATSEQTEQRLSAQIEELQARLAASAQADRDLEQRLTDSKTSIAKLQDELRRAKSEIDELRKQLNVSTNQLQDKDAFLQKLQGDIMTANRKISEFRKTCSSLEEQNRTEREISAQLRAELKETRAELDEISSRTHSVAEGHAQASSLSSSTSTLSVVSADERSSQRSPASTETSNSTIQHSVQFASSLEYLQSTLRQRDGELAQLRREVAHLKGAREKLLSELSEQTSRADRFAQLAGVTGLTSSPSTTGPHLVDMRPNRIGEAAPIGTESDSALLLELQRRYELLLELYGEKLEESNELKMDLAEAKEAYKLQLTELLANQEKNKA
ncbi:hypothetical protein AAHC03_013454 [Spirometra sp. Aus1]